eukprot:2888092-Prymnesium_polylepis.1
MSLPPSVLRVFFGCCSSSLPSASSYISSCSESAIRPVAGAGTRTGQQQAAQCTAATPTHPPSHSRTRASRRWRSSRSCIRMNHARRTLSMGLCFVLYAAYASACTL